MVCLEHVASEKHTNPCVESVIALPQCGIQLETHRGLPSIPLFVQRRFIPVTYMKDILINEALRRWNVRYHLIVLVHRPDGSYELAVAFQVKIRVTWL